MTKPKGIKDSKILTGINRVFAWLNENSENFYADYIDENLDLKIKKIRTDFFNQFKRYFIIRRGFSYIIKDNKTNKEILQFSFTEDTKDQVYTEVVHTCDMLNKKELKPLDFIHDTIVHHIPDDVDKPSYCHHKHKIHELSILIQDSNNNPITNASVIIDNKIEKTTNEDGICIFTDIQCGTYAISISADGYDTLLDHIHVNRKATSHAFILQVLENTEDNTDSGNTENNNTEDNTDGGNTEGDNSENNNNDTTDTENITPSPTNEENDGL